MRDRTLRVAVVNAGGWGTALAVKLAKQGYRVALWARRPELAQAISSDRENRGYLPGVEVPETVSATADLESCVSDADVVVLAVIASFMRDASALLAPVVRSDALVVHGTKGLDPVTRERLSVVLARGLGCDEGRVAVLAGPNHAEEVARGLPAAAVLACADSGVASELQAVLTTNQFRVYTNSDVAGVELCSAAKNVVAIAAGIGDGLGYGDNSKAALITRALAELWRLVERHGGSLTTVAGLAGIGDVVATCTSRHSRNRWAGEQIGRGRSIDDIVRSTPMVIEGIPSTRAIVELAQEVGVEMPICESVYRVLFDGQLPDEALRELMSRGSTSEG
ncbi:MAG: Glycerol-3-phosphate dehydrogenase [Chloroflexi bacterium]|nr:Glycerol-3-phosphate dehydrogenase [Chloroflexota bacterium]